MAEVGEDDREVVLEEAGGGSTGPDGVLESTCRSLPRAQCTALKGFK